MGGDKGRRRMPPLEWVRRWFEIRTYKTSMLLLRQKLKPLDLVKHQIIPDQGTQMISVRSENLAVSLQKITSVIPRYTRDTHGQCYNWFIKKKASQQNSLIGRDSTAVRLITNEQPMKFALCTITKSR